MTKPTLPLLGLMPLLVASLGACTPSTTASDAPMASTIESAAAPTADAADTQGEATNWAMPEPGPFDPNATTFKPCADIPDEVFAELGLEKRSESGETFEPYICTFAVKDGADNQGTFNVENWSASLAELTNSGIWTAAEESTVLAGAQMVSPTGDRRAFECSAAIETPRGTFAVTHTSLLSEPDCQFVMDVLVRLYGKD